MEMKMTMKSTLTSAIVTLGIAATTVPAHAETAFSTLAGIEAEPMNAQEMDAVQGKAILDYGTFSIDNETYPGLLRLYEYATGFSYHYRWIGNQWFSTTPDGRVIVTVGAPSLIYPPGTENIANPWLPSNVYWVQ
jgi:hypothetical protein